MQVIIAFVRMRGEDSLAQLLERLSTRLIESGSKDTRGHP